MELTRKGSWRAEWHGRQRPPLGTDNIRLAVRLDRGGDAYTGTFESNIRDLSGAVVFTARGTVAGDRIAV